MRIDFLIEGGPDIGLGHIYNSTAICATLPDDTNPLFLTTSGEKAVTKVSDLGYDIQEYDENNQIIARLSKDQPDCVVIDRPDISELLLKDVRKAVSPDTRILAIGDLGEYLPSAAPEYCDALVDLDIGSGYNHSEIRYDENTGTLHLVGLQHFVLRPQFYQTNTNFSVPTNINKILLLFGASDPSNFTSKALKLLIEKDKEYKINVVLGPGYCENLIFTDSDIRAHNKDNITVEQDISDVASRMKSCDLLLTSPGLTMIEGLFLGTPVAAFLQNTIQHLFKEYEFVYEPDQMEYVIHHFDKVLTYFDDFFQQQRFDPELGRAAVVEAIIKNDSEIKKVYENFQSEYTRG